MALNKGVNENLSGRLICEQFTVFLVGDLERTSIENQTQETKSNGDGLKGASIICVLVCASY